MHTLMPGMAFRSGRPWLVFGTMGGSAQPQIHVQLLTKLIDQKLRPDEALDAPRFDAVVWGQNDPTLIEMERRFSPDVVQALERRGHTVQLVDPYWSGMGHAHMIELLDGDVYVGAADPRSDSLALGF
jgi:gamma-glutamyltranspeptidase/glutathione hydrolase